MDIISGIICWKPTTSGDMSVLFLPLLIGCDLLTPPADPLMVNVALPDAQNAARVSATTFLLPREHRTLKDTEQEVLCRWLREDVTASDQKVQGLIRASVLDYRILQVTPEHIQLGTREVLPLNQGRVLDSDKRGQMITPLYDVLLSDAEAHKEDASLCSDMSDFQGTLGVAFSAEVPFQTVLEVLYTSGQAQFPNFFLIVDDSTAAPYNPLPKPKSNERRLNIEVHDSEFTVQIGERRQRGPFAQLDELISTVGADQGPIGCGFVRVPPSAPAQSMIRAFDGALGAGASALVLLSQPDETVPVSQLIPSPSRVYSIDPSAHVSMIPMSLPAIGPPGASEAEQSECDYTITPMVDQRIEQNARSLGTLMGSSGLGERRSNNPGGASAVTFDAPRYDSDALDVALINAVHRRHTNQIRYCYQRTRKDNPELHGALTLRFTIGAGGAVSEAKVKSSTLNNEMVESCVLGRFLRMRYPAPKDNVAIPVEQTITFSK